jgi:hypothetical protein
MKTLYCVLIFTISLALLSCASHTVTEDNTVQPVQPDNNPAVIKLDKEVIIVFSIQADYPAGSLSPDAVHMDIKPVSDGSKIMTGQHSFTVEKKGYKKQTRVVDVSDRDGDGVFRLDMIMEAKERIVLINITDKLSGQPITPDQVVASQSAEGEGQVISHQALIKPGGKKLVIQKNGYQTISEDINVKPDEEPYLIQYAMLPLK